MPARGAPIFALSDRDRSPDTRKEQFHTEDQVMLDG